MDSITMLDGAMGTLLLRQGFSIGAPFETLCVTDPARITAIHRAYLEAGSEILYTNTLGANRLCLRGTGYGVRQVIAAAADCARAAAGEAGAQIAVSSGPCGLLSHGADRACLAECRALYREVSLAAKDAGAAILVFETMIDEHEMLCALRAAKANVSLPVFVTVTCDEAGNTPCGFRAAPMAEAAEQAGADAFGINCSQGPDRMFAAVKELSERTSLPLVLKLSAGLPDPKTGAYPLTAETYVDAIAPYLDLGVSYLGGCCGTTPDYIKTLTNRYKKQSVKE